MLGLTWTAFVWSVDEPPLRVVRHRVLAGEIPATASAQRLTHAMHLDLALVSGSGWAGDRVIDAARQAAAILAQCRISTLSIELHEFEGPQAYRFLSTPVSREFARRSALGRPAVFFVADTLNRPAFEAEAVGRANSRTRPEMADTVWVTAGARDLPVVIAHELVHVLADSGGHSNEPGNLMLEETAPGSTRLTAEQCSTIIATGTANGLLRELR